VETKSLDGETNLKIKQVPKDQTLQDSLPVKDSVQNFA
jgi:hypothetical protein